MTNFICVRIYFSSIYIYIYIYVNVYIIYINVYEFLKNSGPKKLERCSPSTNVNQKIYFSYIINILNL